MNIISSAKEIMFSSVSVCLSVNRIIQNTDHIFMKFYGMVGHNQGTNRLDFD